MKKRILVIDDEPNIRLSFRYGLLSDTWEVEEAASGAEAIEKAKKTTYDVMLLDLRMPGLDGLQTLAKLQETGLRIPTVLVSAHATTDTVLQAVRLGTLDFLTKPVTPEQLRSSLQEVLGRFDLAACLANAPDRFLDDAEKLQLAKFHIFSKRYPEARALLQELVGGAQQEEALLFLGIVCEITQDFSAAEESYLKVLRPSVPAEDWKDPTRARWLFEQLSGE